MSRIHSNGPKPLDLERYKVLGPRKEQVNSVAMWNRSIENVSSQIRQEMDRNLNLELMKKYSPMQWNRHRQELQDIKTFYERLFERKRKDITEINKERKKEQINAKEDLEAKEREYWTLVSQNNQLELECELMKDRLKRKNFPTRFAKKGKS